MTATFTDLGAAEMEKYERAALYERVLTQVNIQRAQIARLELFDPSECIAALKTILAAVPKVDGDLSTTSSQFVSGGFNVQQTLERLASQALDSVAAATARNRADLEEARAKLAKIEPELALYS